MKRFLPYILILTILVQLFAPFTLGNNSNSQPKIEINKAEAAEDCKINKEYFSVPEKLIQTENNPFPGFPPQTVYNIETSEACVGKIINLRVWAKGFSSSDIVYPSSVIGNSSYSEHLIINKKISFTLKTGDKTCSDSDCNEIRTETWITEKGKPGTFLVLKSDSEQYMEYLCNGPKDTNNKPTCDSTEWGLLSSTGVATSAKSECKISSVLFNPQGWTTEKTRPETAEVVINTEKCQGNIISNLIIWANGGRGDYDKVLDKPIPNSKITADSTSFKFKTGEYACGDTTCENIVASFDILDSITENVLVSYKPKEEKTEILAFKCSSGKCDKTKWSLDSSTGGEQQSTTQTTMDVYFYTITAKDGTVTNSADYTLETYCKAIRDARAASEQSSNSGATVSDCTKKIIPTPIPLQEGANSGLPECSIIFPTKIAGCIAQGIYYLFFKTTSFVFGLTGKLLDFTVMYSVSDTSYRSTFVTEGWGLIRDFCNMFFIFVLLYIAFGTILNLHSVKTKEMIINVVIIGLLINFSLFATQVIIDASNILARVFYNQNTIVTGTQKNADGSLKSELGEFGEIKLSEAIVTKVHPQKLILEASRVDTIPTKSSIDEGKVEKTGGISVGSFIIVTILATIVNIVGMVAFLMSSIIFIGRVLGLWMAMIFAPLAFFSYTVPALQDMKTVGWKKWWPDTLKLAFLAPVFCFFMYLIVGFLDKGLGMEDIMGSNAKSGLGFVIALIVPFIFIMILLMKAAKVAKDMSGELGQSITNGVKAIGGVALGGAALGLAGVGRGLGNVMAKASRGGTLTQKYETAKAAMSAAGGHDTSYMRSLSKWERAKGAVGSKIGLGKIYGKADATTFDINTHERNTGIVSGLGGLLNRTQEKAGAVDRARHTTDEAVDKAGFKGKTMKDLSAPQQQRVKDVFVKDNKSKWAQEEEDKFRADPSRQYDDKHELSPAEIKELRDQVTTRAENEFAKELKKAAEGVNAFTRVVSKANTGSWDIRKLASVTSDKRASVFTKIPVALIAGVASGVRAGMKNVGVSNGGVKVEGNFLKDLGNTISDSLKSMKVDVDLSHVGEQKSSADAHGGGGHH